MEGTSPTFCLHPDQDDIEAIERELLASPLGSSGSDNCSLHHTPSYHTPGLDPASIQLPPSPAPLENCHTTEPPPTDPLEYASPSDERICRICFAGEEDQAISGRLFSPCRCSGTARHVHVKCLAAWRNSATNKTAFYECSQCRFQYRFARTRISGLATNRVAILATTCLAFVLLTLLAGHLLSLFLSTYISTPSMSSPLAPSKMHTFAEVLLQPPQDGMTTIRYAPSSTAFEIIRSAVNIFSDGEAGEVILGLWDGTVGKLVGGGKTTSQAPTWRVRFLQWLSDLFGVVYTPPRVVSSLAIHFPPSPSATLAEWITHRMTLGVALVGSASFVSFLLSFSLLPIFSVFNTYHVPSFARFGRRRGGGGSASRRGGDLGAVVMVLLVAVGLVRTFLMLYHALSDLSSRLLLRAETAILEVSPTELEGDSGGLGADLGSHGPQLEPLNVRMGWLGRMFGERIERQWW